MKINKQNTEILNQAHQMYAEGMETDKPTMVDIINFLTREGYIASDIDINFDNQLQMYRWTANIKLS